METGRVDIFAARQIARQFVQALGQLALRAARIAALAVVAAHGHVDYRLQKKTPRTTFRSPRLFQNFMTLEEFLAIEEFDAVLEERIHFS